MALATILQMPRHVPSLLQSETRILVDRTIQTWREQLMTFVPVSRGIHHRDRVHVKVRGVYRNDSLGWVRTIFDNDLVNYRVKTPDHQEIVPGFDRVLLGARSGAHLTFNLRLPLDYWETQIAGGTIAFDVTIVDVAEPHLPDLDDTFARKCGAPTMKALRTKLYDQFIAEAGY
jgi:trigger factor